MTDPQAQAFILHKDIKKGGNKLRSSGNERSQRRSGNLHSGHSKFSKNENIIGSDIDHKGYDGHNKPQMSLSHGTHQLGCHKTGPMNDKNKCRYLQIADSLDDDLLFRCIYGHDRSWKDPGQDHKQHRHTRRKPKRHIERFPYLLFFSCSPVLGRQDAGAPDDPHAQNRKKIIILICKAGCRQLDLPKGAQHHGIHHINSHIDGLLQSHRQHDPDHRFIKFWFFNDRNFHFPRFFLFPFKALKP